MSTPALESMGPYERQIAVQLWAEIRSEWGIAHWWARPITPPPPPPPKKPRARQVAVQCGRCNGAGAIASFSIRYSGKCFACGGSGVRFISAAAYKRRTAMVKAAEGAA